MWIWTWNKKRRESRRFFELVAHYDGRTLMSTYYFGIIFHSRTCPRLTAVSTDAPLADKGQNRLDEMDNFVLQYISLHRTEPSFTIFSQN